VARELRRSGCADSEVDRLGYQLATLRREGGPAVPGERSSFTVEERASLKGLGKWSADR
jgi:hypothetical protein